ncbi:MAG: hypothetical protein M1272_01860 [Firmicutes bacterium]|nr:hypothetical protein [Bacillota bacterium]
MSNTWWDNAKEEAAAARIQAWLIAADDASKLLTTGMDRDEWQAMRATSGLDRAELFEAPDGSLAALWLSDKARDLEERRLKEHRELLLILQEALIDVSTRDSDLASRLAARAHVNLKTDPTGQRRFDGLLHRFTGVLHRHSAK